MFINKDDNNRKPPFDGQVFLTTASDSVEADIIESKLAEAQIPVYKKYREPGAYLNLVLGNTTMGIDLFVPEESIEEANSILESA
ncbi:MAG: putative signal transducing protein, partial [Acetivibrionales bacterium]